MYSHPTGFEAINQSVQNSKNLDALGISGIKATPQFASRVDRFQEPNKKPVPNIGPGTYSSHELWARKERRPPRPEWQQIKWQRAHNPPSIPSHDLVFGYEETAQGDLVHQKNPEQVFTGHGRDKVGPGQYESKQQFEKKGKGTQWNLSKTKRTSIQKRGTSQVGPGQYQTDKGEVFPI